MNRLLLIALAAILLLACPRLAAAQTITVGSVTLTRCIKPYDGYCGSITRPFDPAGQVPGTLTVGFELYPHTDTTNPSQGTVIAQEGGPGFSTTGSREGYVRLLAPLRTHRDILLIDKRGTGRSAPIDCKHLQKPRDPGLNAVRDCGYQLGRHAWLYSSTYAADDVAAVLAALQTGPVDYYGDSYATFFGQVLAVRHPDLLRTIVLDSAYPVLGGTPYFATEIENGPTALARVCKRSAPCRARDAGGGSSVNARFQSLLDALRAKPVTGTVPGASGDTRTVTADAGALFLIFYNVGDNLIAYRDLDAAGRTYLQNNDALPLLRLVAEAIDGNAGGGPARQFSTGLFDAVLCADYHQLFDMRAPEKERRAQYNLAIAAKQQNDPNIYAPFTLAEAIAAPLDPEELNTCTVWPDAPAWTTPAFPVPRNAVFPKIPVLVLSGELDTVTSPKEGAETTALFPNAWFVVIRNTGHETAVGDGGYFVPPYGGDFADCAGPIVLAFIGSGGNPGDTSCATRVRPIRTVPDFATSWQTVSPATARGDNLGGADQLTLASAAAETVGDALARYYVTTSGHDQGLRGGRFHITRNSRGYDLHLQGLRWTDDLSVSGVIAWNQLTGGIDAEISLSAPNHSGNLSITWNDRETNAVARISGQVDEQQVDAVRIAP